MAGSLAAALTASHRTGIPGMSAPPVATGRPRIGWLDAAKAWGILLVFYGHFVEEVSQTQDLPSALVQQKLVYAFHMPLFVVISGYLAHTTFPHPWAFLKRALATRLLPVLFFSFLAAPWHLLGAFLGGDDVPTALRAAWVDDWTGYCARIAPPREGDGPARAAIFAALPAEARQLVLSAAGGDSLTGEERQALMGAINSLFDRRDLFDPGHFTLTGLPPSLDRFLAGRTFADLDGDDVRRYNILHYWKALWPEWTADDEGLWNELREQLVRTAKGLPGFNVPTWFLVSLFTLECYHFLAGRVLLASTARVLLGTALFALGGWYATRHVPLWSDIWFAREGVLLYAFYLFGHLLRRTGAIEAIAGRARWLLFLLPAVALATTFQRNPGAQDLIPVVLINLSRHGDPLWFAVGAVGGTLATFGIARLTPAWRFVPHTGRHTLSLMGANGFFFAFFNEWIAQAVPAPAGHLPLFAWCALVSALSIAVSLPAVHLLDRWLPQLVGRPRQAGPLLPPLVSA